MAAQTSVAEELCVLGLTIEIDEAAAKKIKGELLIIEGRLHQGDYRKVVPKRFEEALGRSSLISSQKLYGAAYHAVAKNVVRADTASEVLTEVIPAFLLSFSKLRGWPMGARDLREMNHYVRGPLTEWQGKVLEAQATGTPPAESPQVPKESVAAQLVRLKEEAHLTVQELGDLIGLEDRSIRRHLSADAIPYDRHLRAYEREFSKLLKRKVVISKLS